MSYQSLFGVFVLLMFLQTPLKCFGQSEKPNEVQMELDRLQGRWQLIDYRHREPPNAGVLDFQGKFSGTMIIREEKADLTIKVFEHQLHLNPKIIIRPTHKPKEWDSVYSHPTDPEKVSTTRFIYELKGEKLIMLFFPDPKTEERPKGFDKPVTKTQTMMVWKRVPKQN